MPHPTPALAPTAYPKSTYATTSNTLLEPATYMSSLPSDRVAQFSKMSVRPRPHPNLLPITWLKHPLCQGRLQNIRSARTPSLGGTLCGDLNIKGILSATTTSG
jgi:hypothetical protein